MTQLCQHSRKRACSAYAALKAMVEEEEKSRPRTKAGDTGLIGLPKEMNVVHSEAEERYNGTIGGCRARRHLNMQRKTG